MLKSTAVTQAQTDSDPPEQPEIRELEIVELPGKKRTCRPLKVTEARFRRMLTLIREGHTNTAACRVERVCYTTFRGHIQAKPQWRAELAEAEKIRDEVWRDYALEMIRSAMPKHWVAAMTYLERKHPNQYSLKVVPREDPERGEAEPELPSAVLTRHKQLMLEMLREDAEKQALGSSQALSE